MFVERTPDLALSRSIQSLALQSNPSLRCALVLAPHIDLGFLDQFLAELELAPRLIDVLSAQTSLKDALGPARFVTFLRHGDRLHPSTVTWLAVADAAAAPPDILTWGVHQPGSGGWIQTNPAHHPISLLHFPYLKNAFAVRTALAANYGGDLLSEARSNELHLFQLWLSAQPKTVWTAHPEAFLSRADARVADTSTTAAARNACAGRLRAYGEALAALGDFVLTENTDENAPPYRILPRRAAKSISVIIPFRDHPDLTLRAIASVLAQSAASRIEVVLVNNQSSDETLEAMKAGLENAGVSRWRIVDYDLPFNHSAQCNLGVRESTGEVVVLLNNDAVLVSPEALEEMSAWALHPGIGSVGLALTDPGTREIAAGMEARRNAVAQDSMVEEYSHDALTPFVRNVFGNSFAAAAMPRGIFDAVGMLDAARFPNGFNDVEFACRTRAHGYAHIVLGHFSAEHKRGTSRARADETAQKLLLRMLYPETASAALNDLQIHNVDVRPLGAPLAIALKRTSTPAGPIPCAPLIIRVASRVSASPLAQRILGNPHAFRLIRGAWRLVRRTPR